MGEYFAIRSFIVSIGLNYIQTLPFKEDPLNGDQIRQKESRNIAGYNGSYQKEFFLGNIKTETKTGVQVRYDDVSDIELTRTKDRVINTNEIMRGDINELNAGVYLAQRFTLSKKLDITAALRADYFSNRYNDKTIAEILKSNSTIVSPKLNFNYRVNDKVQLYFYNGRGFHSNDTRVAVQQNGKKCCQPLTVLILVGYLNWVKNWYCNQPCGIYGLTRNLSMLAMKA